MRVQVAASTPDKMSHGAGVNSGDMLMKSRNGRVELGVKSVDFKKGFYF